MIRRLVQNKRMKPRVVPGAMLVSKIYICMCVAVVTGDMEEQTFAMEPYDQTAVVGSEVTLPCRVENRQGVIQWTKNEFGLGTSRTLEGFERYTMEGSDLENDFSLKIKPVLLTDDGLYQCQVSPSEAAAGIRSRSAKLTVLVPPEKPEIVQGGRLITTAGKQIQLECVSRGGKPAATITWLDSYGNTMRGHYTTEAMLNEKRENARSFLALKPGRHHHNRTLTCQVENPALRVPLNAYITLEVKYPPDIILEIQAKRIQEHDTVRLYCNAVANPSNLQYKWYKNGELIGGDQRTDLIIPNVSRDMNGVAISCEVQNSVGSSRATHVLSIHYSPKFVEPPRDRSADRYEDTTLTCLADGNPKPDIIWTFENSPTILETKPTLKIRNMGPEKAGTYHCLARVMDFPEIKADVVLYMKGPPKIKTELVQFGVEGETVHVQCIALSVPVPDKVVWYHNNEVIDLESGRYKILEENTKDGIKNTLIMHNSVEEDFGAYNCSVHNSYGFDVQDIILKRQTNLPFLTVIATALGGLFLVLVVVMAIFICRRNRNKDDSVNMDPVKESNLQVQMDQLSNNYDIKANVKNGSLSNQNEDSEVGSDLNVQLPPYGHLPRYSSEYPDPHFLPKQNNNGYIPYVDYNRDYNPPSLGASRTSIYGTGIDPRYSANYGNPFLRTCQVPLPPPSTVYGVLPRSNMSELNSAVTSPVSSHYINRTGSELPLATHV